MPWSNTRFVDCLRPYASQDDIQKLMESCGQLPTNPVKKAAYAKCLMNNLEKQFPKDIRVKVMENCGRKCIPHTMIEKAKRIKRSSRNPGDLADGLGKALRARLRFENDKIHVVFAGARVGMLNKCGCGMVSKTKERFPSSTFCNCSRGYVMEFFEKVFGKPVKVDLVESIIQGAENCKFVVHL